MHAIEDIRATLRTGAPQGEKDGPQLYLLDLQESDVPRMMQEIG